MDLCICSRLFIFISNVILIRESSKAALSVHFQKNLRDKMNIRQQKYLTNFFSVSDLVLCTAFPDWHEGYACKWLSFCPPLQIWTVSRNLFQTEVNQK